MDSVARTGAPSNYAHYCKCSKTGRYLINTSVLQAYACRRNTSICSVPQSLIHRRCCCYVFTQAECAGTGENKSFLYVADLLGVLITSDVA